MLRPTQPSDELGKYNRKGDKVGAVNRDLESRIIEKAEELAEQRCGREFSELPASLQMRVWMDAEEEVKDKSSSEADAIYDRIREKGFKHRKAEVG